MRSDNALNERHFGREARDLESACHRVLDSIAVVPAPAALRSYASSYVRGTRLTTRRIVSHHVGETSASVRPLAVRVTNNGGSTPTFFESRLLPVLSHLRQR